jgi:hypothetical protein
MARLEEVSSFDLVRRANEAFYVFFERFAGMPVEGTEDELRAMLEIEQTLNSMGAALEGGMRNTSNELHHELAEYRENLLRLRDELRRMENSATKTRGRLFTREQHLQATRAWCDAARSTR